MSAKKQRKSLGDCLVNNFVYGDSTTNPISPQPPTSLMSRLIQKKTPAKEPTVRLTVDLSQSTHKKLSLLCAENGLKKAEVVRMLLDDALKDPST